MNQQEFLQVKKIVLQKYFSRMNAQQFEAVTTVNGAVLVLAGAGSGKTTVIINRIANIILFGDTLHMLTPMPNNENLQKLQDYIHGKIILNSKELQNIIAVRSVNPWQILAITFTNKAAGELKTRLTETLGETAKNIHASTFHSACVRILRTCSDRIGYSNQFTIYDMDDSLKVIKSCMKELNISERDFQPKNILAAISQAKDKMIAPEEYAEAFGDNYVNSVTSKIYQAYQNQLKKSDAMDFDDLIYFTVRIFENHADILEKYQNKFQYIMVDEYQDTNHAQYRLISLLAQKYGNICVVGDDDQSIYSFRGATVENILNFEYEFNNCKVIRLEQNYRSTQNILNTANHVIANNQNRKTKKLWTSGAKGELVHVITASNEKAEAQFIVNYIKKQVAEGKKYSDFAILYRMNAFSNNLENIFIKNRVPYRIYGGIRFQDRKEIKDILAYLSVLINPFDMVRFERMINIPRRGIGESTIVIILKLAKDFQISPLEVINNCKSYPRLARRSAILLQFACLMQELKQKLTELPLEEFFDFMLDKTGYLNMLKEEGENGEDRIANIKEFRSNIVDYVQSHENPTLEEFLEEMSLYTDADKISEQDVVSMMTMHSAKGLEFDTVFAVGMEENIFPSSKSAFEESVLEEERRLAYVTITRAKKYLYLLHVKNRLIFGSYRNNSVSRFLNEIPKEYINSENCLSPETTEIEKFPQKSMYFVKQASLSAGNVNQVFEAGERIRDSIFGDGSILSAKPIGRDCLLEIAFDEVGKKKLMARYRHITKL